MLSHRLETGPGSYLIEAAHSRYYVVNHKPSLKATFHGSSEVPHSQIESKWQLTYQWIKENPSGMPASWCNKDIN